MSNYRNDPKYKIRKFKGGEFTPLVKVGKKEIDGMVVSDYHGIVYGCCSWWTVESDDDIYDAHVASIEEAKERIEGYKKELLILEEEELSYEDIEVPDEDN